jgi:hypothetical protein
MTKPKETTLREHLKRIARLGGNTKSRKQTRARRENVKKAQAARWARAKKKG